MTCEYKLRRAGSIDSPSQVLRSRNGSRANYSGEGVSVGGNLRNGGQEHLSMRIDSSAVGAAITTESGFGRHLERGRALQTCNRFACPK